MLLTWKLYQHKQSCKTNRDILSQEVLRKIQMFRAHNEPSIVAKASKVEGKSASTLACRDQQEFRKV